MGSKAAAEMTWENMSQVLVDVFPELREPYEELLAWWTDPQYIDDDDDGTDDVPGNHVVYGDIFTPYLIRLLDGSPEEEHYLGSACRASHIDRHEKTRRVNIGFDFLEGMCLNEDTRVQEVAVVTVLEYIYGRPSLLALVRPHLGPVSRKELSQLQNAWNELERNYQASQRNVVWRRRLMRVLRRALGKSRLG